MTVNAVKVQTSLNDRIRREYGIEAPAGFADAIASILSETAAANPAHPIADYIESNLDVKPNRRTAIHVASQIVHDTK